MNIKDLEKARRKKKKDWICPGCLGRNGCMCALKPKSNIDEIIKSGKFSGFNHKQGGK